jgi:hypothetical protein
MVGINIIAAKAKQCIINVSPAGCGKSSATDIVTLMLKGKAMKYTSMTLAGLKHESVELTQFGGHIVIDDLGSEKSEWSRVSTVTVLSTLVHTHYVKKITQAGILQIENFYGSASLNIQPVLMDSIIREDDWISVIRDKSLRYYHMIRPVDPQPMLKSIDLDWGLALQEVAEPKKTGKQWYQLVAAGLTQWSFGRVKEHLPPLLKACAALDNRTTVKTEDYKLLYKLMKPMQLERYLLTTYEFETGRVFEKNLNCILVELASHGAPSIETICEDYKCSPTTTIRIAQSLPEWCWIEAGNPKKLRPTEHAQNIMKIVGVNEKW